MLLFLVDIHQVVIGQSYQMVAILILALAKYLKINNLLLYTKYGTTRVLHI